MISMIIQSTSDALKESIADALHKVREMPRKYLTVGDHQFYLWLPSLKCHSPLERESFYLLVKIVPVSHSRTSNLTSLVFLLKWCPLHSSPSQHCCSVCSSYSSLSAPHFGIICPPGCPACSSLQTAKEESES